MDRSFHFIFLYRLLISILFSIRIYFFFYWLCRLSPILVPFGFILYMYVIFRHPECLLLLHERIGSLYAARDEANKCLDLLRQETLKDPIKMSYSCTYGSCTAVFMFSRMEIASQELARAKSFIDYLEEHVATPDFVGISRFAAGNMEIHSFASLVCKNSWGGIAHGIAKRQLGNTISNRT